MILCRDSFGFQIVAMSEFAHPVTLCLSLSVSKESLGDTASDEDSPVLDMTGGFDDPCCMNP